MEDSACDISPGRVSRDESESLWVWIKPAAFYNSLESRYQSNVLPHILPHLLTPLRPEDLPSTLFVVQSKGACKTNQVGLEAQLPQRSN